MSSIILEEKLREASCLGDTEGVLALLSQNVDVNSKNAVNGWTALHWACKRGNEEIARLLVNHGADKCIENNKGETPANVCVSSTILSDIYGQVNNVLHEESGMKFCPNYIKNAPINGQVDIGRLRSIHTDFSAMPTTSLPTAQNDDLILKVRVAASSDPDFIEIEIPRWKLTYNNLLKICCEELGIFEPQVERIRKLPNTRLRKDSDVKRLVDYQSLELVLKSVSNSDKSNNCYQSISTKDQTILY